jgi:hypothetical protein
MTSNTIPGNAHQHPLITRKVYESKDPFWLNDATILFRKDRLDEFFPARNMSLVEQLNAVVRFMLYLSLLLAIYKKSTKPLFIFFGALVFTYLIYFFSNDKRLEKTEGFTSIIQDGVEKTVIQPTLDNPYMNVLMTDYIDNPNREALSKVNGYSNPRLQKDIDEKFNYNLYRDVEDIFDRMSSQRQFYTMPVTTIPSEQGKFANWLYKSPPTCKEGNGSQCIANIHNPLKDSTNRNQFYS